MIYLLIAALIALATWAWQREKKWRGRMEAITRAAGLKSFEADRLVAKFMGLKEGSDALVKEEYLRRLFESLLHEIRQGVAIVDDQLRIKFVNRTLAHLFHKSSIHRGKTLIEELQDHQVTSIVQAALSDQRRTVREVEKPSAPSRIACAVITRQ